VGYTAFVIIIKLGAEPKRTMTCMYAVGATIGFFTNRKWTFSHEGRLLRAGAKYCAAHFGGYLLNLILLYTFVDRLGYRSQWVQAIAIVVVAGYLFLAFKYFVFPASGSRGKEPK
jgi:putative flippase GtrA